MRFYNWILLTLNLISIFFLLQIKLDVIPLFPSNMELSVIENLNELISRFSIGIIISTIFYLIVSVLPNEIKRIKTQKIIQPRLNTIGNQINQSIYYLVNKYSENKIKSIKNLNKNNFLGIKKLENKLQNFNYSILNNNGDWVNISTGNQTEYQHFFHHKNLIQEKIDEIFSLPNITNLNNGIIENLAELRDCSFISAISMYEQYGERIANENLGEEFFEYYKKFVRLKKHCKLTEFKIRE